MIARRVVVARSLVILAWAARRQFAMTWSTNAIAVTGNLTVTNQTAGGYVSVTPGTTDPVAMPEHVHARMTSA